MLQTRSSSQPDIVLVGAGIMSATLALVLKELDPALNIEILETLDGAAEESSDAWNNAGTGHAALCELNYTPQRSDGSIDISKALEVNVEFDLSRQLWSYLVKKGAIGDPKSFIHPIPHMSFVWGAEHVAFLRKRYAALTAHHCYHGMEYSEDRQKLAEWIPLVMEGRPADQTLAATRMITGADVDYGSLTRQFISYLQKLPGVAIRYLHRVTNIRREPSGRWRLEFENTKDGGRDSVTAKFVFLGAGGGALPLLQKSEIAEGKGYGGFPVSGLAALRRSRDKQAASRQGLRDGGARLAAHVDSAPRHAGDRRQTFNSVRTVCRLFHEVPQARLVDGSVSFHQAEQYRAAARGGARQFRSDQISDRPGAAIRTTPVRHIAGIFPACEARGVAARSGRATRADHQARRAPHGHPGIRHRAGFCLRRLPGRAARRFAGSIDRGLDHHRGA
jgi:hypothetical protein